MSVSYMDTAGGGSAAQITCLAAVRIARGLPLGPLERPLAIGERVAIEDGREGTLERRLSPRQAEALLGLRIVPAAYVYIVRCPGGRVLLRRHQVRPLSRPDTGPHRVPLNPDPEPA